MVSVERQDEEAPLSIVYDIESGNVIETYSARPTRSTRSSFQEDSSIPSRSELIAQLAAKEGTMPVEDGPSSVLALLAAQTGNANLAMNEDDPTSKALGAGSGWVITAGDDRVVRCWDLGKPLDGFVICGSPKELDVVFKFVLTPLLVSPADQATQARLVVKRHRVLYAA